MFKISTPNSTSQEISITPTSPLQIIKVKNIEEPPVKLSIRGKQNYQHIEITNEECANNIKLSIPCPCKKDIEVAIADKVPKALSILPNVSDEQLQETEVRQEGKIYVDMAGQPSYATLEQIKQLNTKTIFVDNLDDEQIKNLSDFDMIMVTEKGE